MYEKTGFFRKIRFFTEWKPYPRFLCAAGISTAAVLLIFSGPGYLFWQQLDPENRAFLLRLIREDRSSCFSAAALLIPILWFLWVHIFYHLYILPIVRIADEMPVIHSANPAHRIRIRAVKEIRRLADFINEGAEQYHLLKKSVDEKIRLAAEETEEEKNILAAILSCLSEGVIVCRLSGEILLFNRKAEEFLSPGQRPESNSRTGISGGQYVGLGRNIFSLVNDGQLRRAFGELTEKQGNQKTGTCFSMPGHGRGFLKVEMIPVLGHQQEPAGFILRIHNITDSRNDCLPLSCGMLSFSDDASAGLADSGPSYADLPLIPVHIQDMLETLQYRAENRYAFRIGLHMPEEAVWIYADRDYLVSVLIFFLDRLGREGISEFECSAQTAADYLHIDIVWKGGPVPDYILGEWNQSSVISENRDGYLKICDILLHHEAEWWSSRVRGSSENACLRIFFPLADSSGTGNISPVTLDAGRPDFYDFDLLNRADIRPELLDQLLSNISYTVLDTETTGLDPLEDEIVSIAAVRIVNGRVLKNEIFSTLVDPKREIPEDSVKIHGIGPEMVKGQPFIENVLPLLHRFSENTVLVGHDA